MTKAELIQASNILAKFDLLARARNAALRQSNGGAEVVAGMREFPELYAKVLEQLRAFTVAAIDEQEAKMHGQLAALGVVEEDKPTSGV